MLLLSYMGGIMANKNHPYNDRITTDPAVMAGKPVIKGTRIPVERVVAHLASNPDIHDLFVAYPDLTVADVKACFQYAHHAVRVYSSVAEALSLIGAWSDLDWDETIAALDRIRHESKPTPPIKL
jgi:uncharacterized protein (DUF433 family)